MYRDVVSPELATIVTKHSSPNENESRINVHLSSLSQDIENIFLCTKIYSIFEIAARLRGESVIC